MPGGMQQEEMRRLSRMPVRNVSLDASRHFKQSNRLTEASYTLTLVEQKIILAIISQIEKNADEFILSCVPVRELGEFCGFSQDKMYEQINRATVKLMSRVITFHLDDGNKYQTHWVQACFYDKRNSTIVYELDSRLQPELLRLKAAYVSEADPRSIMQFRSQYAIRFYLMLKQYLKIGERHFSPEELIDIFELGKTYRKFPGSIRQKVVEPAVEEINRASNLYVEVEYIKQNRKMTDIVFRFHETAASIELEEDDHPAKRHAQDLHIIGRLARYGISEDTGEAMIKKYGEDRVERNLRYAYEQRRGKESMSGWLISCIRNDYASAAMETRRIAKEEEEREEIKRMECLESRQLTDGAICGRLEHGQGNETCHRRRLSETTRKSLQELRARLSAQGA